MSIFLAAGYGSTNVNISLSCESLALNSTDLCMIDWRMEAKGVTPIPVATRTACSAEKMVEEGALWGPSM